MTRRKHVRVTEGLEGDKCDLYEGLVHKKERQAAIPVWPELKIELKKEIGEYTELPV